VGRAAPGQIDAAAADTAAGDCGGLEGRLDAAEPHARRRPDLVERDFRSAPRTGLWAADLTQIMTVRAFAVASVRMC